MPEALDGLDEVVGFLENKWGDKQIIQLGIDIDSFLNHIKKYPRSCPLSDLKPGLRKEYPNPYTYLVYNLIDEDRVIEVIYFRSTRQKTLE